MNAPQQLAGRYLLEQEVGRGAMATVFRARDSATGETVAVKRLHRVLAASVTAARFQREIQHLRRLRHENILPLLDFGVDGEDLFFTMPFIEGETLRAKLNRVGSMELGAVIAIVTQLASALDYAHAQNVVHRDLKPENVLLAGGRAVLGDFGVSRAIVASSEDALSSSGIAVGTPTYMSPEQSLRANSIDGRTDIYALGCVTYEMLTGEPPFTGPNLMTLMARHASQAPLPIRTVRPDIPAHVEAAISASLAKKAGERPASAGAYVARLCGS